MDTLAIGIVSSAWRFEALDGLAGTAFVSMTSSAHIGYDELLYLRPPAFEPEPVGRSAIALGATRGRFQAGLMIEGREASFPSLAAIREFVRRAYVRGASGDGGPGEPEGPDEPPPTPQDPDDGDQARKTEVVRLFDGDLQRFKGQVEKCREGEAFPMQWKAGQAQAGHELGELLHRGFVRVLADFYVSKQVNPRFEFGRVIPLLMAGCWRLRLDFSEIVEDIGRRKGQHVVEEILYWHDDFYFDGRRRGLFGYGGAVDPMTLLVQCSILFGT